MTVLAKHGPGDLQTREQQRRALAADARSQGTQRVYARAWGRWVAWVQSQGRLSEAPGLPDAPTSMPSVELVADYLVALDSQGLAASTLDGALAAIRAGYLSAGIPTPTAHPALRETASGARRRATREGRGRGQADPLLPDTLALLLAGCSDDLRGQRDRALLCLGFAGGFRREELSRLTVEHLQFDPEGVIVTLPWTKGSQERSHSRRVVRGSQEITCPVRLLQAWLKQARIKRGGVFRGVDRHDNISDHSVGPRHIDQIVRKACVRARDAGHELPASHYSAHSLRSGLVTAALAAGKDIRDVQEHVGHRSIAMTLRYARATEVRQSKVTDGIGL